MESQRSSWVDSIRGLAIIWMACNHVLFHLPAAIKLYNASFQALGYISMTEIFIFLAGLSLGFSYLQPTNKEPKLKTFWSRIKIIYLTHILLVTLALSLTVFNPDIPEVMYYGPYPEYSVLTNFFASLALIVEPYFIDILPMYILFFAFAPFAIRMVQKGREKQLFFLSSLIYLIGFTAHNYFLEALRLRIFHFNPLTFQIVFVLGIISYKRLFSPSQKLIPLRSMASNNKSQIPKRNLAILGCLFGALAVQKVLSLEPNFASEKLANFLFVLSERLTFGPLRLLTLILFVELAFNIRPYLGRLALPKWIQFIGQHSLLTYFLTTFYCYVVIATGPVHFDKHWLQALLFFLQPLIVGSTLIFMTSNSIKKLISFRKSYPSLRATDEETLGKFLPMKRSDETGAPLDQAPQNDSAKKKIS